MGKILYLPALVTHYFEEAVSDEIIIDGHGRIARKDPSKQVRTAPANG